MKTPKLRHGNVKSRKETALDAKLRKRLHGKPLELAEFLFKDEEIAYLQDYSNVVSIKRLGLNDHGPVHMRKVAINAMIMLDLLNNAGIKLNMEKEEIGTFEDSKIAVLIAAFLHDVGMTVGRHAHENIAAVIASPVVDRILEKFYGNDLRKRLVLRSLIIEAIAGHMATQESHSLEAGVILVADGCDMEKGRARIPMMLNTESRVGDIHKYSASSIDKVVISKGKERPINITVNMTTSVGFFQIEEVLFKKINASSIKQYIELYAGVRDKEMKCYL
ncbi:HD domain-containing protein [bacterium]|nr:HD domain-containing protein [bacterium]